MKIINILAIQVKTILEDEYIKQGFNIDKANYEDRCNYNFLCTVQYKLAIMSMDLQSLNQLFDLHFSSNPDIDGLVFQSDLNTTILEIEKLNISTLNTFLQFLYYTYNCFNDSFESNCKELGISSDNDKGIVDFKIRYLVENFHFIGHNKKNYTILKEIFLAHDWPDKKKI